MEETFKPFSGAQFFWGVFSGVLLSLDEQNRTPPEEWTATDWDVIGKDLLGQINTDLDQAMPSEANHYAPNNESLANENRTEIDAANKRTKIIIAEQKREAAQAWSELYNNAQKVSSDVKSAYWDRIRYFARTAIGSPLHMVSRQAVKNAVVVLFDQVISDTHIRAPSEKLYLKLSNAISRGEFNNDSTRSSYPSADLSDGDLKAHAEIRPPESLLGLEIPDEELIKAMNAIADSLKKRGGTQPDYLGKALMHLWQQKKLADGWATVELNEICEAMGLTRRKARQGFDADQRDAIRSTVNKLESVRIFLHDLPDTLKARYGIKLGQRFKADDPYIIIRNRYTPETGQRELFGQQQKWESISFQPGAVIKRAIDDAEGESRHWMVLPKALTKLDDKRFSTTKLLGNRLLALFRINAKNQDSKHPLKVSTLLDYAMLPPEISSEPKLTNALKILQETNSIKGWAEELTLEQLKAARGGVRVADVDRRKWLNSMVIIEPTDQIAEHYAGIGLEYQRRLPVQAQPGDPISEQLKRTRADRGLTYEQAAEEIGLAVGTLSNIENGSNPRPKTADKIRKWIAGQAPTPQQPSPEAVEMLAKLMYRRHQRESKNNP